MTTRLQLRSSVRTRLEDGGGSPLWSDNDLNEFLAAAVARYGTMRPQQATATVSVLAGATTAALPAGVMAWQIVAVRDGTGADVAPASDRPGLGPAGMSSAAQGWRAWNNGLRLQRAVLAGEAGSWAIDYRGGRVIVADDVSAQPIEAGDDGIVVCYACSAALRRRLVEDGKRGVASPPGLGLVGLALEQEAAALLIGQRRVRSGFVTPA